MNWSCRNLSSILCTVALETFNLAVIWCWESFSEVKGTIDGNIVGIFFRALAVRTTTHRGGGLCCGQNDSLSSRPHTRAYPVPGNKHRS